jgi:hypothetical protein
VSVGVCGGCWARRAVASFPVILAIFGVGLSAPAAAVGRLDAVSFLLAGAVVLTCAAAALVCRLGHNGIKRARAAEESLPASIPISAANSVTKPLCHLPKCPTSVRHRNSENTQRQPTLVQLKLTALGKKYSQ